ncbi:N-acetylmuramoyl-L-alanine amidase [Hydrogenimonas sp.]
MWKGYHDYQSLYMKGLLDQNKSLQVKALQGLIKASALLGLDPSRYKNALKTIRPDLVKKRASEKRVKKIKSANTPASIEKFSASSAKAKKPRLLSSKVEQGRLKLTFSTGVERKSVRHFILERKGRKLYVFDFKNIRIPFSIKRFKGGSFKEIRIAQFDPKKVRIVIETDRAYKPALKIDGKVVTISLPGAKKAVHKSASKKRPPKKASPPAALKPAPVSAAVKEGKIFTIVIDPGHGGKDAGAVGYKKKREKDAVLSVAKRLKKVLQKRGFRVYLTRSSDKFIPLKQRTRLANRKQADFFLSIHANAAHNRGSRFKSKGLETYFLSRARSGRAKRVAALENSADISDLDRYTKSTYLNVLNREKIIESNKLAIDLQKQILTSLKRKYSGVVDNGVREGPFWVLVGAQMPAVLIEIGYITHPKEGPRLFNPNYQKLLAEGIANGIESYIYHNNL